MTNFEKQLLIYINNNKKTVQLLSLNHEMPLEKCNQSVCCRLSKNNNLL